MNRKYIVRLTDQERDELAAMIKTGIPDSLFGGLGAGAESIVAEWLATRSVRRRTAFLLPVPFHPLCLNAPHAQGLESDVSRSPVGLGHLGRGHTPHCGRSKKHTSDAVSR